MRRVRILLSAALLLALLAAAASAQEQTGSIQGTITDASGAVLPGVSVEVVREGQKQGSVTQTDARGKFRFPALLPGTYEVTTRLEGFAPGRISGLRVALGDILTIDQEMELATITENIVVTGEPPVIEITQSATATSISGELIDKLPRGRDFTSVVTQAAHAASEDAARGISIDGASGAENRFVIDGIDTTDLQIGLSGKNLVTDMVQEVQVKSSGYMPEFGGSTGGVINVVTKTGSNRFAGDVGLYFTDRSLNGDERPVLQRNPTTGQAEFITFREDDWDRIEPGFTLGGPLLRDKLWFFASYIPSIRNTSRTIDYGPELGEFTFDREDRTDYTSANISGSLRRNLAFKISGNFSDFERDNLLPSRNATQSPSLDFNLDSEAPNESVSGHLDWLPGRNIAVGVRAGRFRTDQHDIGIPDDVWKGFSTGSLAAPGELFPQMPPELRRPLGWENIDSNIATAFDEFTREGVQGDTTFYLADAAGDHSIKLGALFENLGNNVLDGYQNTRILFYWGRSITDLNGNQATGDFGVYRLLQIATQGNVEVNSSALFVQDSWRPTNRLTLNFGVRAEKEEIPSFATRADIPETAIDFGYGDKVAPRFGIAYDLFGNGEWKAYGSYGVFYDQTKFEMPRGLFGGDKWVDWWFELNTLDWTTINCTIPPGNSINTPPDCTDPLLFFADRRRPANDPASPTIDPNLKPMESVEFVAGIEHDLGKRMSVGLRYVHKDLRRAIEDSGVVVPGVGEVFFISNPGEGVAEFILGPDFPASPRATREYDGIELDWRLRPTHHWTAHASYLYSKLWGNYSGLASSDEVSSSSGLGRASPNVNRFFDSLNGTHDANGNPVFGRLGTDRPHQLKAQAIYRADFGTSFGLNQYVGSGTPVSTELTVSPGLPFFPFGRGDMGRTPTLTQTDLYIEHPFKLGGRYEMRVSLNVLNLFDEDTVVQVRNDLALQDLPLSEEEFFAGFDPFQVIADNDIPLDPRYGLPTVWQDGRSVRLALRLGF